MDGEVRGPGDEAANVDKDDDEVEDDEGDVAADEAMGGGGESNVR